MATNKLALEGQKQESSEATVDGEPSVKVRILRGSANGGPASAAHSLLTAVSKEDALPAPISKMPSGPSNTPSQSVLLVAKGTSPVIVSANSQQVVKQASSHMAPMNQVKAPARTVVISVPRGPKPVAPQTASKQLPASIQIPPGMMLIRSDSGQLMLVSQQALAQAQQGLNVCSGQSPKVMAPQIPGAASKPQGKVTVIKMAAASSSYQAAQGHKTAVVIGVTPKPTAAQTLSAASEQPCTQTAPTQADKELTVTFSRETLESVKKCKNFLVTLIKLASSDSRSATMAGNVKGLVRSLLQGKLEAEEFTERLYNELKSTPQPCLVPFLKKSLPAVRSLTADAQLFIQQASDSSHNAATLSSPTKHPSTDTGEPPKNGQQSVQQVRRVKVRPSLTTLVQSRNLNKKIGADFRHGVLQSGQRLSGAFPSAQLFTQDTNRITNVAFKDSSGSYKEDDDINDVASMAGVNLREENAHILMTAVGSVVQSCQEEPFLSPQLLLSRILHTGQTLGLTEVASDVVALVSHATEERVRGLLQKITVMAEHRKDALNGDDWHTKVSDVRSQLRYLEDIESLKKKKKDEEEKEKLLRLARSRSHTEDPQHQLLKQKAKELQQMERAQLQQKEANLTALAAIGPRKKKPQDQTDGQVLVLPRLSIPRVTRVTMRDLLLCMEQEPFLRHSLTFYKAMV